MSSPTITTIFGRFCCAASASTPNALSVNTAKQASIHRSAKKLIAGFIVEFLCFFLPSRLSMLACTAATAMDRPRNLRPKSLHLDILLPLLLKTDRLMRESNN
jgi:hypothetical protein